jgi:CubicO group peptidase (beta-lactamase class C family)/uncharacterized membrane protein YhhN
MLTATAAVVAAAAATGNWWSRLTGDRRIEAVTKPVTTVALAVVGMSLADHAPTAAVVFAAVGFACCLVGDVALLPAIDRFVVGLGAFLVGHLAFVGMFVALGLDDGWLAVAAIGMTLVLAATVGRRIVAAAGRSNAAYVVPVKAYLSAISVMAVAGWATGAAAAIVGTTLFVVSDSVLGWRQFVAERKWMAPLVMMTYHGALLGLALSLAVSPPSAPVPDPSAAAPTSTAVTVATTTSTLSASTSTTTTSSSTTSTSTTSTSTTSTTSTTVAPAEPATTAAPPAAPPATPPTAPPATPPTAPPATTPADPSLPWSAAAAVGLGTGNTASSVSVWRDGAMVLRHASGRRLDGAAVDADTPFVIASVSKVFTALAVARLVEQGVVDTTTAVPWTAIGVAHHPDWDTVTVRELLDHTSGMPVARKSWLDLPGPCAIPLAEVMAAPPTATRGEWRYSNGNYCALGLLVEHLTGLPLDAATSQLVFEPAGVAGPSLNTAGARPDMAPYAKGVGRLDRLGGAGAWLASSDDVAAVVASITPADLATLTYPAIMNDQYGWGHTGTLDGAKACAWRFADGTVVAGVVAGDRPSTGGGVCDRLVTALAVDLGLLRGAPLRLPR